MSTGYFAPPSTGFQSLSRDSGRLNVVSGAVVLQALGQFQSLSRDSGRLNLVGSSTWTMTARFQSLSRDSGRLNQQLSADYAVDPVVSIPQSGFGAFELARVGRQEALRLGRVSIPQSGFGAFEPHPAAARPLPEVGSFNPSVGIRGV